MWMMNGSTVLSWQVPYTLSDLGWVMQHVGDFNGDGKTDILWRHSLTGEVGMWLMDGFTVLS